MSDSGIENRGQLATTEARELALDCIEAGIEAAHPRVVVESSIELDGTRLSIDAGMTDDGGTTGDAETTIDLEAYDEVLLLGAGKATGTVAEELAGMLEAHLTGGAIVTKTGESVPGIESYGGGHPVPTAEGVAGAERILELAASADDRTLVLAVITGGGSALATLPASDLDLEDIRETTDAMLEAGMEIHEINAVRKHLSAIKGGRLALAAAPARVATLVFSDVVGNDLSVIASGPTVPDESTYEEALAGLDRYAVDVPVAVREHLERGVAGELAETPGGGNPAFDRVTTHVLADGMTALEAAESVAREADYGTIVLSSRLRGEAREAAKLHAGILEEVHASGTPIEPPAVVLSGGELTVTVRGEGAGGPNTEFALATGLELGETDPSEAGTEANTTIAAVDTDGIDGGSDAAGGLVDATTIEDPAAAREALDRSDAGTYLHEHDGAIVTGATGTNVNDLRLFVLEKRADSTDSHSGTDAASPTNDPSP